MSSIDLNIVQRGLVGNDWTAEKGPITSAQLDKVGEQKVNNGVALNSLPTPFARFFVVSEAYRRVLEEKRNSEHESGLAYKRLVSDSLDVIELLYYFKYHNNQWDDKRKIVIKEWTWSNDLPNLKKTVPILGNIVEKYYESDLGYSMETLYFVVLQENGHEYLLGTSSPMTLFVTPPDLDKKDYLDDKGRNLTKIIGEVYENMTPIKRRSGKGHYFLDVQLFDERPTDFKNYLYSIFANVIVDSKFSNIQKYMQAFITDKDIKNNWTPTVEPIYSEQNNILSINGIDIKSESGIRSVNFLADKIVKVPFRINSQKFVGLKYNVHRERQYDYLLPLTHEALEHIDAHNFTCECLERTSWIEINLYLNNQLLQSKRYVESGPMSGDGVIIDFSERGYNFGLALFPNILSDNQEENNYFKLMLVTSDNNDDQLLFTSDAIECTFYKNKDKLNVDIEENYEHGVKPSVIRTKQKKHVSDSSTEYYEVFNTVFDAICLCIKDGHESMIECAVIPRWEKCEQTNKSMTFAIDLGTTNTYISCRKKGQTNSPEQLVMKSPMVSYLQESNQDRQLKEILRTEKSLPIKLKPSFNTEFVPAFIDGSYYKFPIRTALCKVANISTGLSLFDNTNIAFFYEKQIPNGDQEIDTDIKWAAKTDNLRIFIKELLLIIKCIVLQSSCKLSDTDIVWFRPLSLRGTTLSDLNKIWQEEAKKNLNIGNPKVQVKIYTESEAPYYYFKESGTFEVNTSIAVVDIGGGSTDIVYFENGILKLANSVHFGCDVLWGNGFNNFTDARDNGIYKRYKDVIKFKNPELQALNTKMKSGKMSTKDIIDFWISNDNETKISEYLRADFKPYFLYHFMSIIYYMALMFKNKDLTCPREIVFSGNGSRYIDQYLTENDRLLTEIVMDIIKQIYPDCTKNVRVVLPDVRKESTCYGGLYHDSSDNSDKAYYFIGVSRKIYSNVKELASDFSTVIMPGITDEIKKLNTIYLEDLGKMYRDNEISKNTKAPELTDLNEGIEDSLNSQFQQQVVNQYSETEQYNDTLFFLPIINNLFKMSINLNTQAE